MKNKYDDIIKLNRPISRYKTASMDKRAAQFGAFQALTGYEELIDKETKENMTKFDHRQ